MECNNLPGRVCRNVKKRNDIDVGKEDQKKRPFFRIHDQNKLITFKTNPGSEGNNNRKNVITTRLIWDHNQVILKIIIFT